MERSWHLLTAAATGPGTTSVTVTSIQHPQHWGHFPGQKKEPPRPRDGSSIPWEQQTPRKLLCVTALRLQALWAGALLLEDSIAVARQPFLKGSRLCLCSLRTVFFQVKEEFRVCWAWYWVHWSQAAQHPWHPQCQSAVIQASPSCMLRVSLEEHKKVVLSNHTLQKSQGSGKKCSLRDAVLRVAVTWKALGWVWVAGTYWR